MPKIRQFSRWPGSHILFKREETLSTIGFSGMSDLVIWPVTWPTAVEDETINLYHLATEMKQMHDVGCKMQWAGRKPIHYNEWYHFLSSSWCEEAIFDIKLFCVSEYCMYSFFSIAFALHITYLININSAELLVSNIDSNEVHRN